MPQRSSSLRSGTLLGQWYILLIRVKGMWQIFLSSLIRRLRRNDCGEPKKKGVVKLRKSKLTRRKKSGCVEPRKSEPVKLRNKLVKSRRSAGANRTWNRPGNQSKRGALPQWFWERHSYHLCRQRERHRHPFIRQ